MWIVSISQIFFVQNNKWNNILMDKNYKWLVLQVIQLATVSQSMCALVSLVHFSTFRLKHRSDSGILIPILSGEQMQKWQLTYYSTAQAMPKNKKNKWWRTKTVLSAAILQNYSPRSMGERICGEIWLLRSVLIRHNKDIQLLRKTTMHRSLFPYHLRVQKKEKAVFPAVFC